MEQSYFIFWTIMVFIVYYMGKIERDNQKKIMYCIISIMFFLALAFLSFGVENIIYDAATSSFVKYNEANNTLQAFLPFGFFLILAIVSSFELIVLVGEEWRRTSKGLKIPKGF